MKRKLSAWAILVGAVAFTLIVFSLGCTNAQMKNFTTLGDDANVQLYSGGVLVKEWTSDGKVSTEDGSDGYLFKDKATGKLVRITGVIIITN